MIEIVANFTRETIPVFLSGELVEIFVNFSNPDSRKSQLIDTLENLAWASVQIICYCSSTLQEPTAGISQISASTSLNTIHPNGKGDVQNSTKPKILFCDLRLAPGETKSYFYREQLLYDSPPTYRGVNIKYFYRIKIATQRVGSKVQTLNIPIRVLPLPISIRPEEITALCDETNEELTPSNPFMDNKRTESYLELAMDHLQNITARRRPNFYVISNLRGKVGRFCLFKSDYRLGEDIVGTLDFSSRTVRCIQFSVTLQCEEILARKKLQVVEPKEKAEESEKSDAAASLALEVPASGKITSYSKHHDVCLAFLQTQLILPIPLHVTPSFKTDLVDVRWKLHFEFVTSICKEMDCPVQSDKDWRAPTNIDIETMIWNLPVKIFPTSPMQMTQTNQKYKLIIK